MKSHHLLLLFVLLPVVPSSSSSTVHGGSENLVGGWTPIKDPKDSHVKEIGKFAVDEHNKEAKTSLVFKSVISGQTQVVSGTNYKLILSAKHGGVAAKTNNRYQTVVWGKPGMHFKNLTSFKALLK